MAEVDIPCIKFPELPKIPEIQLIGGAKLSAFLDASKGMPNNCTVVFSLMGQLAPMLASLVPILHIIGVIKALQEFASNPLVNGPDLIEAIGKVAGLFLALTPAGIAVTIVGILRLLISFLQCVISILKSSISFQAEIDLAKQQVELGIEPPNLVLEASLECAELNAKIALEQASAMLGPVRPLMDVVGLIVDITGLPVTLPTLEISASDNADEVITQLESAVSALDEVINSIPV